MPIELSHSMHFLKRQWNDVLFLFYCYMGVYHLISLCFMYLL